MSAIDQHTKPKPGDAELPIDALRGIAETLQCVKHSCLDKHGIHNDPRLAQSIGFLADELERQISLIEDAVFPGRRHLEDAA